MSAASSTLGPEAPQDDRDLLRWGACFAAVLAIHVGAAVAVMTYRSQAPIQPSELPAVVMIDMAPPTAAPSAPSESIPNEAQPEAAAPDPTPDPVPDVPTPEPIPEPEPQTVTAQEPPPLEPVVPDPPKVEEVIPPTPVQEKAAVALPPPPPKVQPKPKPVPKPKPKVVEHKPPKPVQATRRAERQEARRPPAEASGAQTTASLPSASNGSSAASRASWQSQLVAYLQRNLRYPPGSRGGGSAAISFSLNRQGRVLSASLVRSSGTPELDQAALSLFHGGLPPPPPDVSGNSFSFTIPIRFNMR